MTEERRGFTFEGKTVWLTLTELQGRLSGLSGMPTKHVMATWEEGVKKVAPEGVLEFEPEPIDLLGVLKDIRDSLKVLEGVLRFLYPGATEEES